MAVGTEIGMHSRGGSVVECAFQLSCATSLSLAFFAAGRGAVSKALVQCLLYPVSFYGFTDVTDSVYRVAC